MIRLGEKQKLKITRKKDFGVYLSAMDENGGEGVLLPAKEVPEGALVGDTLDVFIYRDSSDRLLQPLQILHSAWDRLRCFRCAR